MHLLAEELQLPAATPTTLTCPCEVADVFDGLPYNRAGQLSNEPGREALTLDLRAGSAVAVTGGNFAGCLGRVVGKNAEGHYLLKVTMDVGGGVCIEEDLLLGSWWLFEARAGQIATLPVVQAA